MPVRAPSRRAALAGVEFALVAPALLVLFLGTIDISNALLTMRRLEVAAAQTAEIATTEAAKTASQNVLGMLQAWQSTTAPFALFPQWTDPAERGAFSITLSAVEFTASPHGCASACAYAGAVAWSVASELGQPTLRPCGPVSSVPDGSPPSYASLPAGVFGASAVLVADVSTVFTPMFYGFLVGDLPMMRSAYVSPRIGGGVRLAGAGGQAVVEQCG